MVLSVRDKEITGVINRHEFGVLQLRAGGLAVVAAKAAYAISRDGGDDSAGTNLPDAMVRYAGDEEIARFIDRYTSGAVQLRADGLAAVAAEACRSRAGEGGDQSRVGHEGIPAHAQFRAVRSPIGVGVEEGRLGQEYVDFSVVAQAVAIGVAEQRIGAMSLNFVEVR